jgi:hypothetical protein
MKPVRLCLVVALILVSVMSTPSRGADSIQARASALARKSKTEIVAEMRPLAPLGLSPEDISEIADAIGKGGEGGMAIAAAIVSAIAEVSGDKPLAKQHLDKARSLARSSRTPPRPSGR